MLSISEIKSIESRKNQNVAHYQTVNLAKYRQYAIGRWNLAKIKGIPIVYLRHESIIKGAEI